MAVKKDYYEILGVPKIATDDDIIDFLTELGEITPAINSDGSIYTDNQNRIILIWGAKWLI